MPSLILIVGLIALGGVSVSTVGPQDLAYADSGNALSRRVILPAVEFPDPFALAAEQCSPVARRSFLVGGERRSSQPGYHGALGDSLGIAIPARIEQGDTVRSGDTLTRLMRRLGVRSAETLSWYRAALPVFDLSRLRPGHEVTAFFEASGKTLEELHYELDEFGLIVVERGPDGVIEARRAEAPAQIEIRGAGGAIGSSLTADCLAADVPRPVIQKLSDIFAWEVDFRRLQKGDRFRVLYEMKTSLDGKLSKTGRVLAAEVETGGKIHTAIHHEDHRGRVGYFDLEGRPVAMSAIRFPVKFTRISSKFSRSRKHPVFGRRRPHLGVDFAAPRGTPVRAIAGGRVVYAGRKGQLGRAVRIDHRPPSRYDSIYGHLNRIAKGVARKGWVQKGQIIGYVGSTGAATGPHLHFSLVEGKRYVDPLKALPAAASSTLARPGAEFHEGKGAIVQALATLDGNGPVRLTRVDSL
ncbi:MAG: peptidoglycan DD-metalloendopeptidase family protein [bacterium]